MSVPRGIRNNNPGNIEHNPANDWLGLAPLDEWGDEKRFCVFTHPHFGIRVTAYLLHKYYHTYGLTSVYEMLKRYAPKKENDTLAYARFVAGYMGVKHDAPLERFGWAELREMIPGVIRFECGVQPYTWEIEAGIVGVPVLPDEIRYIPDLGNERVAYA